MVFEWFLNITLSLPYSVKIIHETDLKNILGQTRSAWPGILLSPELSPLLCLPSTWPRGWCSPKEKTWHHKENPQEQGPVIPSSFANNSPVPVGVVNVLTIIAQKRSAEQCPGCSQNLCDTTGAPRKCPKSPNLSTWSSCERLVLPTAGSNGGCVLHIWQGAVKYWRPPVFPLFSDTVISLNCSKSKRISAHKWVL